MTQTPPNKQRKEGPIAQAIMQEFKKGKDGQLDVQLMAKAAMEETDIDIVSNVCLWMKEAGIAQERIDVFANDFMVKSSKFKSSLAQIVAINNFFHTNLRHMSTHAYYARSALQVFDKAAKWEKVFKELVLPYLVDVNAPFLPKEEVKIPETSWEEKLAEKEAQEQATQAGSETQTSEATETVDPTT